MSLVWLDFFWKRFFDGLKGTMVNSLGMPLEYKSVQKELALKIHESLPLDAKGFVLKSNFEFLFETVNEFPESAGIIPSDVQTKIIYVACYLIFYLTKRHPFSDGNKRTAFLSFSIFLMGNGFSPFYSEAKSNEALDKITQLISNGERPLAAIEETFKDNKGSREYKLIRLLFELSGADPAVNYESPVDIYPQIKLLVIRAEDEKFAHPWLFEFIQTILKKLKGDSESDK